MSERVRTRGDGRASREAFVAATGELLRRQGYAASGLNEIVARSGAPRGSLYFHFPGGKEELAAAAIEASGEQLTRAIGHLLSASPDLATALGALVDALAAGLESSGYAKRCPAGGLRHRPQVQHAVEVERLGDLSPAVGPREAYAPRGQGHGGGGDVLRLVGDVVEADPLVAEPRGEEVVVGEGEQLQFAR